MKSIASDAAASNLDAVLNSAQKERIVLTRNGKASAVIVGVEGYDDEDLRLAASPEFWQMIESRRSSGGSLSLAELKERLGKEPQKRAANQPGGQRQGGTRPKAKP